MHFKNTCNYWQSRKLLVELHLSWELFQICSIFLLHTYKIFRLCAFQVRLKRARKLYWICVGKSYGFYSRETRERYEFVCIRLFTENNETSNSRNIQEKFAYTFFSNRSFELGNQIPSRSFLRAAYCVRSTVILWWKWRCIRRKFI